MSRICVCECPPLTSPLLTQCVLMGEHLALKIAFPFDLQDGFVITVCIMCANALTDDDISVVAGREKSLENVAPATCTKIETLVLWMVKTEAISVCY